MAGPNVNRNGPDSARFFPARGAGRIHSPLKSLAKQIDRELDHGLASRNLLPQLVLDHDIDQYPARFFARLLGLDDSRGLDGVARPNRLDPARLKAAVDGAGRIGP